MSTKNIEANIVEELRSANEPALSAKDLSESLDISVRTVNNYLDKLIKKERIKQTQIGNASAYYVPFEDLPSYSKPDHTCKKCGRSINNYYDFAKIDINTYFQYGNIEDRGCDFYIFCRFCFEDFIFMIYEPSKMGEYSDVHSWNIPDNQLEEVRNNPDVITSRGEPNSQNGDFNAAYQYIKNYEDKHEFGVHETDIINYLVEERDVYEVEAERLVKQLHKTGYLHKVTNSSYKTAK